MYARIRDHRHTLAILAIAVSLRLLTLWFVLLQFPRGWVYSRGVELGTLAQSLAAGRGLSSPFRGSTGPTALLAPGYPALIALIFSLLGAFTPAAAIAIMSMQLVFSAITVLLIMHISGELFGPRAAHVSGAFWAISLPLLWMPTIFWETCLSTLLLTGMVALALRWERQAEGLRLEWMGVYTALAVLVNPALLPSLVAMLGWCAWRTPEKRRHLVPALLVLCLVFAPWPIRNALVLHAFIPLRSTVGLELWMGNRAGATGFLDESVSPIFNRGEYDQYVSQGEARYMGTKSALARAYMRAHPSDFLRLSTVRGFRFWSGTGSKDGSVFYAIHAVLTTSLGMAGIWRLFARRRVSVAALFLLPLLLFPLPYYITHAEFRYRLVVDPLLTILAGYAVSGRDGVQPC
jgi:hypothetical protein